MEHTFLKHNTHHQSGTTALMHLSAHLTNEDTLFCPIGVRIREVPLYLKGGHPRQDKDT